MKKSLFEQMGGTYRVEGDYLIPNLILPCETDERDIGVYGRRHLDYIEKHRRVLYTELLTRGKLRSYLSDLNEEAHKFKKCLVKQMTKAEDITEKLKETNQMAWVGAMNSIHNQAQEIIKSRLIYKLIYL